MFDEAFDTHRQSGPTIKQIIPWIEFDHYLIKKAAPAVLVALIAYVVYVWPAH